MHTHTNELDLKYSAFMGLHLDINLEIVWVGESNVTSIIEAPINSEVPHLGGQSIELQQCNIKSTVTVGKLMNINYITPYCFTLLLVLFANICCLRNSPLIIYFKELASCTQLSYPLLTVLHDAKMIWQCKHVG